MDGRRLLPRPARLDAPRRHGAEVPPDHRPRPNARLRVGRCDHRSSVREQRRHARPRVKAPGRHDDDLDGREGLPALYTSTFSPDGNTIEREWEWPGGAGGGDEFVAFGPSLRLAPEPEG